MNYQTYLIAFDGNWIAVVSAKSEAAARAKIALSYDQLGAKPEEFEVRRIPPGEAFSLHLRDLD